MDRWKVYWVSGNSEVWAVVFADDISLAYDAFRDKHPEVPGIAIYKIECN